MVFQPDLFSVSLPSFVEPDEVLRKAGEVAFVHSYEPVVGRCRSLRQVGGSEVNSRNLKVETSEGSFLIKWIPGEGVPNHERGCSIAAILAEQGTPIARPLANKDGGYVSRDEQGGWSLWRFVDGAYFSGDPCEMAHVAHSVQDLQGRLSHLPVALWPGMKVDVDASHILATFSKVDRSQGQWEEMLDEASLSHMRQHWPAVMQAAANIEETASGCNAHSREPTHYDLHPHNILMRDGQVAAILDVDAIVQYSPLAASGFAAFKLFRQHAVRVEGGAENTALYEAFETFSKALAPQYSGPLALAGARLEVSRRLGYILNALLSEGKSDWGHVLGVQLSAFTEIAWLLEEA